MPEATTSPYANLSAPEFSTGSLDLSGLQLDLSGLNLDLPGFDPGVFNGIASSVAPQFEEIFNGAVSNASAQLGQVAGATLSQRTDLLPAIFSFQDKVNDYNTQATLKAIEKIAPGSAERRGKTISAVNDFLDFKLPDGASDRLDQVAAERANASGTVSSGIHREASSRLYYEDMKDNFFRAASLGQQEEALTQALTPNATADLSQLPTYSDAFNIGMSQASAVSQIAGQFTLADYDAQLTEATVNYETQLKELLTNHQLGITEATSNFETSLYTDIANHEAALFYDKLGADALQSERNAQIATANNRATNRTNTFGNILGAVGTIGGAILGGPAGAAVGSTLFRRS